MPTCSGGTSRSSGFAREEWFGSIQRAVPGPSSTGTSRPKEGSSSNESRRSCPHIAGRREPRPRSSSAGAAPWTDGYEASTRQGRTPPRSGRQRSPQTRSGAWSPTRPLRQPLAQAPRPLSGSDWMTPDVPDCGSSPMPAPRSPYAVPSRPSPRGRTTHASGASSMGSRTSADGSPRGRIPGRRASRSPPAEGPAPR